MSFLKEYTLLEELGKGGFATVYKVRHNELGYIRAIRVLSEPVTSATSKTYQKFLRECKVLLRLGNGSHRNIVHIYQPRFLENHALVEMDYVDGINICKYLEQNGCFLPINEVLNMVEEISSALAYCHEDIYSFCMDRDSDNLQDDPIDGSKVLIDEATRQRLIDKYKIIHNDIHSGNIMRRNDGSFVLLDFGLAITGTDDVRNSSRHENGAVEYKAPEKWDNESTLTEESDIYSFGVVMYEYLTGKVPFPFNKSNSNKIKAAFELGEAHKIQTPPSIFEKRKEAFEEKNPGETYVKDYPDWLEETILKCLDKDPKKRFHNGKELFNYVEAKLKEKTTVEPVAEQPKQEPKNVPFEHEEELNQLREEKKKWNEFKLKVAEKIKSLQNTLYDKEVIIRDLNKKLNKMQTPGNSKEDAEKANERIAFLSNENKTTKADLLKKTEEIKGCNEKINELNGTIEKMKKRKPSRFWLLLFAILFFVVAGILTYFGIYGNNRYLKRNSQEIKGKIERYETDYYLDNMSDYNSSYDDVDW